MLTKYISPFQDYLDKIKGTITRNFNGRKQCVALVLYNGKGEILLLKRSLLDSFHPSTWCLPGGGIDAGEFPLGAVKREAKEEAGLKPEDYDIYSYWACQLPGVVIHYYVAYLRDPVTQSFIYLDEKEHAKYKWCNIEEWTSMDLILQLKEHLAKIMKN